MPRVSVIVPTYNRKDYVQETIDSVLTQTYTDFEVIVIDDGSSDGTGEVLRERYGDHIVYIWQENQGESVARNYGIEISNGEYIALLDSDDLWLPEKLAKQVLVLDANQDTLLVFTPSWLIDKHGKRLDESPLWGNLLESDLTLEAFYLGNLKPCPSSCMIRRNYLELVGGFDPTIQYGEDWDLWLKLRQQGPFAFIDEPLTCIRQHSGSQWHSPCPETVDQRLASHIKILERFFADWPRGAPNGLLEIALARSYGIAAFLDYFIGRTALGQQRLLHAIQLDPDHRSELQYFPKRLKYEFFHPNESLIVLRSVKEIVNTAIEAFENWPQEIDLSIRCKNQTLRDICVHFLFQSYEARDFPTTRYCLAKAIQYNPALLFNRGVFSIGLEAILGTRIVNLLRSKKRQV